MNIEVGTIIAAFITGLFGPLVLYLVTQGRAKNQNTANPHKAAYLEMDYGIKIVSPKQRDKLEKVTEITGVYSAMPPPKTLRLFIADPNKTASGERYWPQSIVVDFFPETKSWSAKIIVGGDPGTHLGLIAAIVGESTNVLWDFYYKVGPTIGWWDFEGWPKDDTRICDRIEIIVR